MPNSQDQQSVRTAVQTEQIAAAVGQQTAMLRTVLERLDELVQLLTPKPSVLLKRIDARTAVLVEPHLQADATPVTVSGGANGKGARG